MSSNIGIGSQEKPSHRSCEQDEGYVPHEYKLVAPKRQTPGNNGGLRGGVPNQVLPDTESKMIQFGDSRVPDATKNSRSPQKPVLSLERMGSSKMWLTNSFHLVTRRRHVRSLNIDL